jgi:hypothetical protein
LGAVFLLSIYTIRIFTIICNVNVMFFPNDEFQTWAR